MEASSNTGHVVAFPHPTQGHITPMLTLCSLLASRGFAITFVNAQSNHDRLMAHYANDPPPGISFVPIPDNLDTPIAQFSLHTGNNLTLFRRALAAMQPYFERVLEDLVTQGKIKCVLSDLVLDWTQDSADRFGIPRIVLRTESAASLAIQHYIPELIANGHVPVSFALDSAESTISYLPGFPLMSPTDLPYTLSKHAEEMDPGFARRVERMKVMSRAAWVMVNSFDALEHGIFESLRAEVHKDVVPVGPLLPPAFLGISSNMEEQHGSSPGAWPEDSQCLQWLDKQAKLSVLYVSFGSNATLSIEHFKELARGLGASKQPFLWVLRQTLVPDCSSSEDLVEIVEKNANVGQACTVSWAPQLKVLSHASVGCFLTHCGWNSTMESICAGVPMLCWPLAAEQNLNCKFIVDEWKIGSRLKASMPESPVERGHIERTVVEMMVGEEGMEMRRRARKLKEAAISEAMNISTKVQACISHLVSTQEVES